MFTLGRTLRVQCYTGKSFVSWLLQNGSLLHPQGAREKPDMKPPTNVSGHNRGLPKIEACPNRGLSKIEAWPE